MSVLCLPVFLSSSCIFNTFTALGIARFNHFSFTHSPLSLSLSVNAEADEALRGAARSRRNPGHADHQNPALSGQANQPAVCGQRSQADGVSVSCSSVEVKLLSPGRLHGMQLLQEEGLMFV